MGRKTKETGDSRSPLATMHTAQVSSSSCECLWMAWCRGSQTDARASSNTSDAKATARVLFAARLSETGLNCIIVFYLTPTVFSSTNLIIDYQLSKV